MQKLGIKNFQKILFFRWISPFHFADLGFPLAIIAYITIE